MKKHQFTIDTSGLTAYVEENDTRLLTQLAMTSDIAPYAEVFPGMKGTQRIHFLSTNATFQTDGCSYNASGSTPFTEKEITVADIAIMEDICMKTLNGFWAQQILKAGSRGVEELAGTEIARAWMEKKLNLIKKQINVADWQGDTNSVDANLNKYNGLLKEIFADANTIDGNTSNASTATSEANILDRMKEMYLAIPTDMFEGAPDGGNLVWFMDHKYWRYYTTALLDSNLFHFVGGEKDAQTATTYYGTNIIIVPQIGLADTDKMVITTKENIALGVDLQSDEENIEVWYSKDDRTNHSLIAFKRGITYKWSDYIVRWGLGTS